MVTVDEVTIGARLRTLRRWRGIGQTELAGLAGVSQSFISMVEGGQRALDRRAQIAAIAAALRVSETDLVGGPHLSPDPLQSDPHLGIPTLRVALQTNTLTTPAVDRARPLAALVNAVTAEIGPMRRACDYVGIGRVLPDVLDELHYHVAAPADEAARQRALLALVEACVAGTFTAKNLRHFDLAYLAARRGQEAAALLDDPVAKGKADFAWLSTLPHAASQERNLVAATRAADQLEPQASDPLGLQVLGMISLTAALSAAVAQQEAVARHWLDEATRIARHVPDEPEGNWQSFSTANVNIWRVTVGVERGESGGAVLDLAGRVDLEKLGKRSSRRAGFFADVGRGLARDPKTRTVAVRWLAQAEAAAPQRVRNSAAVQESVAFLLGRARAAAGADRNCVAWRLGWGYHTRRKYLPDDSDRFVWSV